MTKLPDPMLGAMAAKAVRRERLHIFLMQAFPIVAPGNELSGDDYLEALCYALQTAALEDGGRLMVTMPPRYLKSIAGSVVLCAWLLGRDPTLKIMVASYADALAKDQARLFRRLVESGFYRSVFPHAAIKPARNTATEFVTAYGGGRRAVTVGGSVTGMGADLIIIDDLMKAGDALSEAKREEVRRFFDETLVSRLNNKSTGSIIVLQQRLHQDDLIAHLQERGTFDHLNLPAIAEVDETYPIYSGFAWVRPAGSLLAPTREPREVLDGIRTDVGEAAFTTQYQQDPASAGSSMLDFSKLTRIDGPREGHPWLRTVQSWDTAIKDGPNCDYSVCMTFGWDDERWVVLDVVRRRMKFDALRRVAIEQAEKWKPELIIVEDSANGSALVTEMQRQTKFHPKLVSAKGSKEERFNIAVDYLENGRIALIDRAPYFYALRQELLAFPGGRHDDQVDALSQFVRRLRMPRPLPGDPRRRTRRRR